MGLALTEHNYFSVQVTTICAVVKLTCAAEKVMCALRSAEVVVKMMIYAQSSLGIPDFVQL